MKKTLFILGCYVLAMTACASPEERAAALKQAETTKDTAGNGPATTASAADITAGEQLIAKNDCIGCHNKDNKIIGPAYVDIAAKYPLNEENVNHLVEKVISGGKGVWGEIPMTPHDALNKDDVKKMVTYILSVKK
ncbi:c-type cytochrome [Pedobacter heparinus]|uniref:Cytochrome c class I n=1 Tax=Pedobacter heparinus (strain ATCC 13125 / DSM 2366 / CIP 104194 / JCM 7457 / NBRC 12017 / NCIMB 9290 / NRRL B-14731 / HIM 762-3) TaxID=485917 RepID=C6XU46_PEDHD|nr:c-type cytochrome [Pedobacter heparinus]ACU05839.1 cytochrome c class I [Pedobacter heparinus DSM 2366]